MADLEIYERCSTLTWRFLFVTIIAEACNTVNRFDATVLWCRLLASAAQTQSDAVCIKLVQRADRSSRPRRTGDDSFG